MRIDEVNSALWALIRSRGVVYITKEVEAAGLGTKLLEELTKSELEHLVKHLRGLPPRKSTRDFAVD